MADIDLDAIRARAEAATRGPWMKDPDEPWRVIRPDDASGFDGSMVAYVTHDDYGLFEEPDAEFIAHAREDVPALLAEVERLREAWRMAEPVLTERDRLATQVRAVREMGPHRIVSTPDGVTEYVRRADLLAALDDPP